MNEIIRDAPFGQLVRYLTGNRFFKYREEMPDFECPYCYEEDEKLQDSSKPTTQINPPAGAASGDVRDPEKALETPLSNDIGPALQLDEDDASTHALEKPNTTVSGLERVVTIPYTDARLQADQQDAILRTESRPIRPTRTADGVILATWYTTDDPENPQNWSRSRKGWSTFLISLYTLVVYASSSIYVPSTQLIMERFGVAEFKASLGLALYVLGYGIGPLVFAPLSEVPAFGRNIPYVTTFALFVILAVPTALVDNLGGLLTLRFLLGIFGSPCLANGGASMGDMYSLLYLPYPIAIWVLASFAAPAIGPLLSGFAVYAENWRWSQWEILWMAAPVFLLFFFFLPETSPSTILLHRSARLRAATGNNRIRTQTEIDRAGNSLGKVVADAIIKPLEITAKDPAILFVNLYTAIIYGTYYSFFEVFPLVYGPIYGFNVGETSIVFLCISVGSFIALAIHFTYLGYYLIPDILKNGMRAQEHRLVPALFASFGPTIGLFIFGWTARESIHWIVTVIGITIYATACFILIQCIFTYVPMSYPEYAASLFAGNDFFRSLFAFGAVLFSRPMYVDLGVAKGISLLGGLSVIGIIGIFILWIYGAKLRAKSKFAI